MNEADSTSTESLIRPWTLVGVLAALAAPIMVLVVVGGPIGILLLYIVLVIDGIALAYFAFSRSDSGDQTAVRRRTNDIDDGGYYFSDVGLGSLANEVMQAGQASNYYSVSSRARIARLLSDILQHPRSGLRIRRADESPNLSYDLRTLLSYDNSTSDAYGNELPRPPIVRLEADPTTKNRPTDVSVAPAGGRERPRSNRSPSKRRDIDYLSTLERAVSTLEESKR